MVASTKLTWFIMVSTQDPLTIVGTAQMTNNYNLKTVCTFVHHHLAHPMQEVGTMSPTLGRSNLTQKVCQFYGSSSTKIGPSWVCLYKNDTLMKFPAKGMSEM